MRDPRYDILFEPVRVGPLTVRNRFWQVPHCSGMGYRYPNAEARMRGIKADFLIAGADGLVFNRTVGLKDSWGKEAKG